MNSTICQYCDTPWNKENTKATYMDQESDDCMFCVYCDKPNFITVTQENRAAYKSGIRKVRVIQILQFYIWVPLLVVYIALMAPNLFTVMMEDIRRTLLVLLGGVIFLCVPIIPITSCMVPIKKRKKLIWKYGEMSKTTYEVVT